MSWPQLAHTFLPADGTELAVEVGEHTDGVEGLLLLLVGEERVSSRSMLDRCDSPSECGCSKEARLSQTHARSTSRFTLLAVAISHEDRRQKK